MADWTLAELQDWQSRIRDKAAEFGLDCYPQVFEICDEEQMLGYMAYHGMPSHYPHWSYGKAFEKLKTLYRYGVTGLPYEMVINSNESIAYLMKNNSLCLQILTIAHVYGHNDFFKNNFTFKETNAELTLSNFKSRAVRVREYIEDPGVGIDKVEALLDAAHALSFNCRRNFGIRKLSEREQRVRATENQVPVKDPYARIHKPPEVVKQLPRKLPLEPEEDLLLFIRDHNPYLADWERDLLTIVHEEAQYFIPQMETKIMNEGWASFWHHRILNALDLPQHLQMEFMVHHSQVIRPHSGEINPYYLGFKTWHDILRRADNPTPDELEQRGPSKGGGLEQMFEIREVDRDSSFLRRFLTHALMKELDLFEYRRKGSDLVVTKVADEENWQDVKQALLKSVGTAALPVLRIDDADFDQNRTLHVVHEFDGRELSLADAEKTLQYVHQLWGRPVLLETMLRGKKNVLCFNEGGFSKQTLAA